MKILTILLMFFLLSACNSKNSQEKIVAQKAEIVLSNDTISKETKHQIVEPIFQFAHNLKSNDGVELGTIFIKPLVDNKEVFSSLIIINDSSTAKDTLYKISGFELRNSNGIDITVYDKDLYGYLFVNKEKDSFVIQALHNKGKNVSDNIWIRWNEEKRIFEVEKAP